MMSFKPVCLCFLFFILMPAYGQQPEEAEVRFYEAYEAFDNSGRISDALPIWEQMAEEYKGTFWGAKALLAMANWSEDFDEAVRILERVVSEYPNSDFEFIARLELALLNSGANRELVVQNLDTLAQSIGGPSLEQITSSPKQASEAVRALPVASQRRLRQVTDALWVALAQHNGPGTASEKAEALPVALFIRNVYAPLGVANGRGSSKIRLSLPGPIPAIGSATMTSLDILSPAQSEVTSLTPEIQAQIVGGDVTSTSLDMEGIVFELDGQSIIESANFETFLGAPEPGTPFETVMISYTPAAELSVGEHTLYLKAQTEKVGNLDSVQMELIRKFSVGSTEPGPISSTTTKDAIVLVKEPHRNEGANKLLTLEKITGKATRNVVDFDLSSVQNVGLTSATLVFTIDPNEHVNGWGNGETVTVQTLSTPWVEGNGKSFGLNNNQQVDGTGSGVTWFSPIDENISNDSANSVVQWDGGSLNANPATAPPVTVTNHQTGEISFDVTQDILNGAEHGWLLSKDKENKGSKVSFYSKEGAAAAGNPDLAPRLILEYGGSSADAGTNAGQSVASSGHNYLKAVTRTTEGSTIKEVLQENATVAYTGQLLLTMPLNKAPVAQAAVRTAYRSWLNDSLTLANLAQSLA